MASMHENNDVGTQYRPWMARTQSAPTLVRAAVVHDCTVEHDPGRDEHVVDATEARKDLLDGVLRKASV
jgi:hypothetical protein